MDPEYRVSYQTASPMPTMCAFYGNRDQAVAFLKVLEDLRQVDIDLSNVAVDPPISP